MVARVDTGLREELDIADGLADSRVYVLDPCCGTGAYLVEVLNRINDTIKEKGEDALTGNTVKRAAMERVFGFEIIKIDRTPRPVYLTDKGSTDFYIRAGNTTRPLDVQATHEYISMHWET